MHELKLKLGRGRRARPGRHGAPSPSSCGRRTRPAQPPWQFVAAPSRAFSPHLPWRWGSRPVPPITPGASRGTRGTCKSHCSWRTINDSVWYAAQCGGIRAPKHSEHTKIPKITSICPNGFLLYRSTYTAILAFLIRRTGSDRHRIRLISEGKRSQAVRNLGAQQTRVTVSQFI